MLIEASRRVSRVACERIRKALIEYDRVAFKEVQKDLPAERAFSVVKEGRTFVVRVNDPTITLDWWV